MKYIQKVIAKADKNGDKKLCKREFVRFFARFLKSKYCGRTPKKPKKKKKCIKCIVKRTAKVIIRSYRRIYCAYKKRFPFDSPKKFLTYYFKKYSSRGYFTSSSLVKKLKKTLPRKYKRLHKNLRTLK